MCMRRYLFVFLYAHALYMYMCVSTCSHMLYMLLDVQYLEVLVALHMP